MNILSESKEVWSIISSYEEFEIIGHKEPDGDCLGSQLALFYHLTRLGKSVKLFSHGPFERAEVAEVAGLFQTELPVQNNAKALTIVTDCSNISRLGRFSDYVKGRILVIDHHATGEPFGTDVFVDGTSPSTTYLVQQILELSSLELDKNTAYWLLFGFCTDTGFFRHLETGCAPYFAAVSRLLRHEISLRDIFMQMYGGKHPVSRKLIGKILSSALFLCEGKLCVCVEKAEDREGFGNEVRDSDSLYQLLLTTRDVEIIVYLRQENTAGEISGGIRTRSQIDAGKLAAVFGGGGHVRAAGFSTTGDLENTVAALTARAKQLLG